MISVTDHILHVTEIYSHKIYARLRDGTSAIWKTYDTFGRTSSETIGGVTRTVSRDVRGAVTSWATPYITQRVLYGTPHPDARHPEANRRKYGGKELLTEGGLNEYDFEARRLTPLGSFSQPDPLAFLKSEYSPYSYCHADPVNFIDPTGLFDTRKEAEEWAN